VLLAALAGRWPELLPWAIALLGAQYAVALLVRSGEIDGLALFYAGALFATAELAYWAFERGPVGRAVVSRVPVLVAQALGAAAAGAAVLAVSVGGGDGGLAIQAVGLAAAAAAVGLVTWLAWTSRAG
jgi:hypothetical protein